MDNLRSESTPKVARRNDTNSSLKTSTIQLSPGNRLHRIEHSGDVALEKEQLSAK